jgi:hypothetical protein
MRTSTFLWLVSLTACLLTAGCSLDSKNPLSSPKNSKPDTRLAGVWRVRDRNGDLTYLHVGTVGAKLPSSVMRVLPITHTKNGDVTPEDELLIFPTTLGANTYLNMPGGSERQIKLLLEKGWNPEAVDGFFILKYKLEGDALLIWLMDSDAKERAIKSGKIKGLIKRTKDKTDVEFTDTTENVARFVAGAGDELFSKEVNRLERVK